MRFSDKAILVTGGAMGIGRATVERVAREGARAIIADVDADAATEVVRRLASEGCEAMFQPVDLADPASIEAMGAAVAETSDALHGLVNNCGIARPCTIQDTGDHDWEPQVSINLRAAALCAKALLPLLKRGPGHVVNVSSEGGFRPRAGNWVYDATKVGVCALARSMACEFAEFGMRANTVAPGWTVTEMHFGSAPDPASRKRELEELAIDSAVIRRLGRPEEIAAAIAFLLSDDASYITATTLHVDGGKVAH